MLRNKLLYAALVFGLACFYVLYIDYLPLVMLLCALAIPLVLKIGLVWLHFQAEATLECSSAVCTANAHIPMTVIIQNHSPLWFSKGIAKVHITHGFGSDKERFQIRFPVQSRNTTRLTFYVAAESCGIVTAELTKVHVYDVFQLLHTNIRRKDAKLSLLVLPKPIDIPLDDSALPVENPESTQFADKPGDDPSELFGIREYQAGDPVSRIHWKLSSHSDTLYLKQFGAPIDKNTLLLVEYCPPAGNSRNLQDAGALLTVLYSLVWQLIQLQHPCAIAWYDAAHDEVQHIAIKDETTLADAFRALYSSMYDIGSDEAALRYALGAKQFSSAVLLTNLPETQLLGFLEHSVSANHRTVLLISCEGSVSGTDETAILHVSPEDPMIDRLIV